MPQLNEINITNWTQTGLTPQVPQWRVHIQVKWIDDQGNPQVYDGDHLFPNELQNFPLQVLRRMMEQLILMSVRVQLGLNTWSDYE